MKLQRFILVLALAGCEQASPADVASWPTTSAVDQLASNGPILANGSLEAITVDIVPEVNALIVSIDADEGQTVRQGQTLARLDDTLVRARRRQAEAAVQTAQAVLAQARAEPRPDAVLAADAELARSEAELVGANQAVTDTRAIAAQAPGLSAQIAQAEAQVKLAQQDLVRATADMQQAEVLRDTARFGSPERDVQQKQFEAAQANHEAAKVAYDGAVGYLSALQRVRDAPADLIANANAARSQAGVASARRDAAQAGLEATRAGATAEDIALAEADVAIAQANLSLVDAQLTRYALTSPISGVVTQKIAQAGEVARAGVPVLVVSDLREMKLKLYVPVTWMGRVSVGQAVQVRVPAYPDETFAGAIAQIASEAEFTPNTVQTRDERAGLVYAVTVRLSNPDGRLKAGMPADALFGEA